MITPEQIRAARAFLDWSTADLAGQAGITVNGINKIERGHVSPHKETLLKLQCAFELSGIEFIPLSGIKKRENFVVIWEDTMAYQRMLDDIYYELRDTGGEVLTYGLMEPSSTTIISVDTLKEHMARLAQHNIKERVLVKDGDTNFYGPLETYHWIDDAYFSPDPICVYGTKIALVIWNPQKVIVIDDDRIAESVRLLFNFVWDHTQPVTLIPKETT